MPPQTPEDPPQHRYARAAGRATRAFLDASRKDAEEAGRAARDAQAAAERERARRQAADPGPSTLLRTARWWWSAVTVLFALLTASFLVAGLSAPGAEGPVLGPDGYLLRDPLAGRTGQYVLAGLTGVLTVATGTGAVQLLRSRRSAAGLLTGIAVLVGVPLILRGHPLLIVIAVVLLAGAALLWLPPVRRRLRAR